MKVRYRTDHCSMTLDHCSRIPLHPLPSAARLFPSTFAATQEHLSFAEGLGHLERSETTTTFICAGSEEPCGLILADTQAPGCS